MINDMHLPLQGRIAPDRPDPDRDVEALYVRSYLLIRTVVGVLGLALPFSLIFTEAFFLAGPVGVRDSISSYYHSPARDLFVAAMSVIGFLLVTYMAEQPRKPEFWFSSVSGLAALGVVAFPTERPALPPGAPRCGVEPEPTGCSPMQQLLGERATSYVHLAFGAVFVLGLAAVSYVFTAQDGHAGNTRRAVFHLVCSLVVVGSVALAVVGGIVGFRIFTLTPLYVAEVISVWAFGSSWLVKGRALRFETHSVSRRAP